MTKALEAENKQLRADLAEAKYNAAVDTAENAEEWLSKSILNALKGRSKGSFAAEQIASGIVTLVEALQEQRKAYKVLEATWMED